MPPPGKTLRVTYVRDGKPTDVNIVTKVVPDAHGKPQGRLGFSPMPAMRPASIVEAAQAAWWQFSGSRSWARSTCLAS